MAEQRECFTYRIDDEAGNILYVGMTYDVIQRIAQHSSKPWFPTPPRIRVRRYPNRQAAATAEADLIAELRPLHNVRPFHYRATESRRPTTGWRCHIATALRRARMTQAELARRLGEDPATISRIVNGRTKDMPVVDLIKIADTLGVRTHVLLDGNFDCPCVKAGA